ncbi:MAG: hydantoinase/oxoprolinase family protein, partial [Solirubrobacterales bacterium]
PVPAPETFRKGNGDASRARRGERSVFLHAEGVAASTPIYETDRLQAGDRLQGPAVVEAEDSTVLVHPGQGLWVDELLNLRLEVAHDA